MGKIIGSRDRTLFCPYKTILFLGLLCLVCLGRFSYAGQGMYVNTSGLVVVWDHSAVDPVLLHPESGTCASYTNGEMLSLLEDNLEQWSGLEFVDLDFTLVAPTESGGLNVDVTGNNYDGYLALVNGVSTIESQANAEDGINPVVFDDDGEIIDAVFGSGGRVAYLGFSNAVSVSEGDGTTYLLGNCADGTTIEESQSLFNCYCLETSPGSGVPQNLECCNDTDGDGSFGTDDCGDADDVIFSEADLNLTMVHEIGHALNLDHTAVNTVLATDSNEANDDDIPTMYPEAINAEEQISPTEDDLVALSSLYPADDFFVAGNASSAYCLVTGSLVDRYGEELRCAQVVAATSDYSYNASFISGAYAPSQDNNGDGDTVDSDDDTGDECLSNCGDFQLYLRPGRTYSLSVADIDSSFVGGSGISPCNNEQLPVCTQAMIDACDESALGSDCAACVVNETLVSISSDCTAGATVALGNVTTQSISWAYARPAEEEEGGEGGCSLGKGSVISDQCSVGREQWSGMAMMFLMGMLFLRRRVNV